MNNDSNQRWLAIGLLGLVFLSVLFLVIVPVVSIGLEYHEQEQELLFRLERTRQIVSRKDHVKESIAGIKNQFQKQNYFSTRETEALASADLQKIIKTAISQAGGQLTSTQVLPHNMENGFNQVTVKVRMSGDIEMLRSVLYEIEASEQIMIINQLDIRPVRGKRNRKTRKIEPSNKMNINFQVVGFMRKKDE